jgi:glycyl-tRNA synthetase alpha subunit
MREIAIVSRAGVEIGVELFDSITCLRSVGINPRNAAIVKACAVLWVDDEEIWVSVNVLRHHGFEAAHVAETDDSA